MTLVPADESKDALKKYEELWNKIRDRIISIIKSLDKYNEKYIEIKFNSDDDLRRKKTPVFYNMIIVFTSVFHEGNKYYPQVFSDQCLYKL